MTRQTVAEHVLRGGDQVGAGPIQTALLKDYTVPKQALTYLEGRDDDLGHLQILPVDPPFAPSHGRAGSAFIRFRSAKMKAATQLRPKGHPMSKDEVPQMEAKIYAEWLRMSDADRER